MRLLFLLNHEYIFLNHFDLYGDNHDENPRYDDNHNDYPLNDYNYYYPYLYYLNHTNPDHDGLALKHHLQILVSPDYNYLCN